MKISSAKYGCFISYLTMMFGRKIDEYESVNIENYVINMIENELVKVNISLVNELMKAMFEGTSKIEAIKAYRTLTGEMLKESKDAVEKFWIDRNLQMK